MRLRGEGWHELSHGYRRLWIHMITLQLLMCRMFLILQTIDPRSRYIRQNKGDMSIDGQRGSPVTHRSSKHNNKEEPSYVHPKTRSGSTIVSPLRSSHVMEINVTKRVKGATRALTFSPNSLQVDINGMEGDQMIGTLNDMETTMDMDDEKLDYGDQDDDLLGEELLALQEKEQKGKESRAYSGASSGLTRRDKRSLHTRGTD
ncbi:unnamed protein product [Eruca vesicaria subsp. sativa]|uniref:Uncharacterized protein n=1 Tax=Eruca vesicaria subsp. sativa TaxID=29727 RepID=A0ABC8LYW2_ERUVS|nr:unnamed protein product [Eruca vesicaria subsp. sativa]